LRLRQLLLPIALIAMPAYGQELMCPQMSPEVIPLGDSEAEGIQILADEAVLDRAGGSVLSGGVFLRDGDRAFSAESLRFDESQRLVTIADRSIFRSEALLVVSESAEFNLAAETGSFHETEFTLIDAGARGGASELHVDAAGTAIMRGGRYTTCAPEDNSWMLQASSIRLNHEEGLGTATHARLHFLGVPILYVPWFQFPIDNRRRTGLLFPTVGNSSRTGVDLRWPIYINLAPNYDAQLIPRYMSRRGLQLGSEFRYLMRQSRGSARVEHIANDEVYGDSRTYGEFAHEGRFSERLAIAANYAEVSDREYFEDFGGNIDLSALTFLERRLQLIYNAPAAYTVGFLVQNYQVIDPSVAQTEQPYRRLPQITFDALSSRNFLYTRAGISAEYVNFDSDDVVEGQRTTLTPFLRTFVDRSAWFFGSRADLNYTAYELRNTQAGQPRSPSRSVPTLSAEGGLRFERMTDSGNLQTLEPRLFYLYTPFRDQNDLPVFDSGEPDFDIVQLFARNRFSGIDRISDANQLAGAVTSRLLDADTGEVRWSATLGQLLRFSNSAVTLPGQPEAESGATDFIAGLDYRLSRRFSAAVSTLWSPDDEEFNRLITALRYRDGSRRADVAYRYRRDILEQADVSFATPLLGRWEAIARWRYSIADNRSLESVVGMGYETCCWTGRVTWRRYLSSARGDFDSGIYLQLELKGLGGIGSGFMSMLPPED
jgi:LPS-assembly protein